MVKAIVADTVYQTVSMVMAQEVVAAVPVALAYGMGLVVIHHLLLMVEAVRLGLSIT